MNDPRRRTCDELAELLATPEGQRTARLLQLTEALEPRRGPSVAPAAEASSEPLPISIWRPRQRAGELIFERPEPHPLGDHHARRRTLRAAKPAGRARICFFGESVAAGYLYAPRWTPAEALERALCRAAGDAFEVVDLARTNETLASMAQTVERSLQLEPDVLVIFAGNNWSLLETPEDSPYAPSVKARQRVALALRRGGLAGLAELARRDLAVKAEATLSRVAELARRRDTPLVVVVPEVNLADWQDHQPVAWLPGDGSRRWHALYAQAAAHLDAERCDEALETADAILELDGGLCSTSHRLRAEALASLGRGDEAQRAGRAEVESGGLASLCCLGVPRVAPSSAELLRRSAGRHDFAVVDLPRLFAADSTSPGRRLFLDYCHLSAEGIERAMAAVSGAILTRLDGAPKDVAASAPEVEPAVEAVARLGAAVHGAHRLLTTGDKRAYLEHWCLAALAADPTVAGAMHDLLAARCAPCPAVMTPAQQRNLTSPHRLLLQHGWRWHHLDVELIEALCATLEDAGHPVRAEVEASLLAHYGVGRKGVDLSRRPYLWEPLECFYPEAMAPRGMTGRAIYRSPWPESSFCLIADGGRDVRLELTLRLPAIDGDPDTRQGDVAVRLDGREIGSVSAGESWTRQSIRLAGDGLSDTIHRLSLTWPPLPACGDEAIESAIRRLENGVDADLHPVFGEVFSLIAKT